MGKRLMMKNTSVSQEAEEPQMLRTEDHGWKVTAVLACTVVPAESL